MKKIISVVIALILCLSFCLSVSASDTANVYTYGNVEVIFAEDSSFDAEMQQHIAYIMVNGDDDVATYNLWCNLFGHKETVELIESITHKVDEVSPRCLSQYWEIHACSRCYASLGQIMLNEAYIVCCPED